MPHGGVVMTSIATLVSLFLPRQVPPGMRPYIALCSRNTYTVIPAFQCADVACIELHTESPLSNIDTNS
jgi:hypothetical protein